MYYTRRFSIPLALAVMAAFAVPASAQLAPEVGFVFPAGGKAGTTVDVKLGGHEFTPDMQFFVHDPRVKLEVLGPPGELLIPPPPFWFGGHGRQSALPISRELPARFTLPADLPAGPIRWQAANANGITSTGVFVVGTGTELVEVENRKTPQVLPTLPAILSGRLWKNEEVDRYKFTAAKAGPITCELFARRIGVNFNGVLEVTDMQGKRLAEVVDTDGSDPVVTFVAVAGAEYEVAVRDIDHAGDRSYVYRLSVTPGPRVELAIPPVGKRGETREVEFVGVGIATGTAKLESLKKPVAFPAAGETFTYKLETPFGTVPYTFALSDLVEVVAPTGPLGIPGAVTGVFDQAVSEARYTLSGKKGDRWSIAAAARRFGSPLDLTIRLLGLDGKDLVRNEDLPGTTDAGLEYTVPADGAYTLVVSDTAGATGTRTAVYRVAVRMPTDGFSLTIPTQKLAIPLGTKGALSVKATRTGAFKGPIALTITGMPAGIKLPADLTIPADKPELALALDVPADMASTASLVRVTGTATVGGKVVTLPALAPTTAGNLAPLDPEEMQANALVVATTMKPRVKGEPVDKDTGRRVPRGSTHPAEIALQRLEGYAGEITLKQSARQSYQIQGITGGTLVVPPAVTRPFYPVFMPEWLETTRTSRCGVMAEVKVADPKGTVRTLLAPIDGFITMHVEGALLKLSHPDEERTAKPGEPIVVKVKLARSARLTQPVKLELRPSEDLGDALKMEPITVGPDKPEVELRITTTANPLLVGDQTFTIRGSTVMPGNLAVMSETTVKVTFAAK